MEIVPINQIPTAEPVIPDKLMEIYKVCLQMEEVCKKNKGVGLSAVQVGIPWNLFIIKKNAFEPPSSASSLIANPKFDYYLNCEYSPSEDKKQDSVEGCLSLLNENEEFRQFLVERFVEVRVIGQKLLADDELNIEDVNFVVGNPSTIVFQHEIDHSFSGILVSDIGKEIEVW